MGEQKAKIYFICAIKAYSVILWQHLFFLLPWLLFSCFVPKFWNHMHIYVDAWSYVQNSYGFWLYFFHLFHWNHQLVLLPVSFDLSYVDGMERDYSIFNQFWTTDLFKLCGKNMLFNIAKWCCVWKITMRIFDLTQEALDISALVFCFI